MAPEGRLGLAHTQAATPREALFLQELQRTHAIPFALARLLEASSPAQRDKDEGPLGRKRTFVESMA